MPDAIAVVLAAGKGTRMKSDLPKVLHPVCGRAMVEFVLDAVSAAGVREAIVVVGHQAERVQAALAHREGIRFARQEPQLGTGHAVMQCEPLLRGHDGPVLVVAGDTPLLTPASLARLLRVQRERSAACVIGTAVTERNAGLGRIVRDADGTFLRIVEEKDATDEQKAIREVNTGCYAFDTQPLLEALRALRPENKQGEYYLTDCAAILLGRGGTVLAEPCFSIEEAMGVNTPEQRAAVEELLSRRGDWS
ncbi:MAG: glycosyl transferase family 2 [Planctomycetota bacterium]|nr:MAG: glycosyl transferase family 2 [Planctomycetota bacterium]